MIGETVGHYRVLERLGGGAMGVVYRAEDDRLARDVALKFLPPDLTGDAEARDRFTREARAASALDHANICTIYDVGETEDGQLFIAMAFYAGETLKARLGRGPLEIDEALDVAIGIARGLERAHEGGIVHRDIKPANVMITEHGEVRILDFGIAKLLGEAGPTRTGAALGTLAYMAPEQVDSRDVGPATDLWGLGAVLYEMLTGSVPFAGSAQTEIVASILAREPARPVSLRPDLPAELESLVLELLRKKPGERPSSATEVAERLETLARPRVKAPSLLRMPTTWIAAAATVVLVAAAIMIPARGRARVDAARATLPEIEALAAQGQYIEAHELARRIETTLLSDTTFQQLMLEVSDILSVRTDPPGATVTLRTFPQSVGVEDGDAGTSETAPLGTEMGTRLGTTPIDEIRIARGDHLLTIEAEGHEPIERVVSSTLARIEDVRFGSGTDIVVDLTLDPEGSRPEGMVPVPAGPYTLVSADAPAGATADLERFWIDRYEVSNADFRAFVREGGYADPTLWTTPIQDGGRPLGWEEAVGRFRDRTGLPGPRGWSEQRFEAGADAHPVTGITWHEAAAYCAWRGTSLPTLFEWEKAARGGAFTRIEGVVLPWGLVAPGASVEGRANFASAGPVDVDAHPFGISPYGAYGMAGNAREFVSNRAEIGFLAMGGSWQDPHYVFASIATADDFFASSTLGFRCALRETTPEAHGAGQLALERRSPTYEPVDEATYRSFLSFYRYDPVDLEPEVLSTVETDDWTKHTLTFAGLGSDRILAHLYLPRGAASPYQTMVFVASSGAFFAHPADQELEWLIGANVRAGRAAFAIVFDGMAGRAPPGGMRPPASSSVEFRNLMVKHGTELSLGLDYLATRDDIDMSALAYVGLSWGAGSRSLLAAIDDRWRAVVFVGAGVDERVHPTAPEALNVNFIPYIRAPKLVVNGAQDEEHPWLTRAKPFWDLLREPKTLVLEDDQGHVPSPEVRVPAINDFLDRVLGPVRR